MWLVVWTYIEDQCDHRVAVDRWEAFDTKKAAEAKYLQVKLGVRDLVTASLCVPIESTDYTNPLEE